MDEVLPVFKSQYSLGRSILTLEKPDDMLDGGPDSIIDIAEKNGLEQVTLVDDSMTGFLQAYKNLKEKSIKLLFGLRVTICPDLNEKSEDSINGSCKYIILSKNTEGYKKLIKISSHAAKKGFYYEPRTDFKFLESNWDNKDLTLAVPFYDSFLYYNTLTTRICLPRFDFTEPTLFEESNDLPFDEVVKSAITSFTKDGEEYPIVKAQSVYYKNKEDLDAFTTYKLICSRKNFGGAPLLEKPNFDHFSSDQFCWESYLEKNAFLI